MITSTPEEWHVIPGWRNYEAGERGHVKLRSKVNNLKQTTDTEGVEFVTLTQGRKQEEFQVDQLVCLAFNGAPPDGNLIVEHLDSVPWNNWASNLRWAYPIMATNWYCGPIKDALNGFYRFGPYKTKIALNRHLQVGHILVATDDYGKLVAFEFVFWQGGDSLNPFDQARYFRAYIGSVMEIEKLKGMDIVVSKTPYEAAQTYHELASMHPEFIWARYLHEAADMIELMANQLRSDIKLPITVVASNRTPIPQRAMPLPTPEYVAPARMTIAPRAVVEPTNTRRTIAPRGLFK